MINDLHQQGLSISAIARKVGCDRKTVKKYIERGLEAPCYGPRAARSTVLDPYAAYLSERVAAFPDLSGRRLLREIRKLGYEGSYSTLKPFLREVRRPVRTQFERRFETPVGQQAQLDFAEFSVAFTDEPGVTRTRAEAEDVAAQDQGFISAQYYWQWLADYVVNKSYPA